MCWIYIALSLPFRFLNSSGNGYDFKVAKSKGKGLVLKENTAIETPIVEIGYDYTVEFEMLPSSVMKQEAVPAMPGKYGDAHPSPKYRCRNGRSIRQTYLPKSADVPALRRCLWDRKYISGQMNMPKRKLKISAVLRTII